MSELWKDIPEWSNFQASNLGRIRSIDRYEPFRGGKRFRKGRIMKQRLLFGYPCVGLKQDGRHTTIAVHRAVALCFVDNPNHSEFTVVNHKDCNKQNNIPENLEWCTQKMNIEHAMKFDTWTRGENHGCSKLTEQDVRDIRNNPMGCFRVAKLYGIAKSTVLTIRKNKTWKHVA